MKPPIISKVIPHRDCTSNAQAENMQANDVQNRQAVFVRCYPK